MSWSSRRTLVLSLPVLVMGCGFTPVYGPGGAGEVLYQKVEVAPPVDRLDYLFVEQLDLALGRSTAPEYLLTYDIRTIDSGQAVTATGEITRFNLVGTVDYQLTRKSDESIISEGQIQNFAGYSATGSTLDTLAAERDAARRLMIILADQTVDRLFVTVGPNT